MSYLIGIGLLRSARVLGNGDRISHDMVIIGRNRRTSDYVRATVRPGQVPIHVVGILDCESQTPDDVQKLAIEECEDLLVRHKIPVLGAHWRLTSIIREKPVDEVLITLPIKSFYDEIGDCIKVCQEAGIPVSLSTDLFGFNTPAPNLMSWGENSTRLNFDRARRPRWKLGVKRAIDLLGSLVLLGVCMIPMLIIALLIKLTSRGPVFFVQERVGLNHKPFKLLKFRTMVRDAEQIREKIEHMNEQSGPVFKMRSDPRVTIIGKLLRKYSLDELPQFFNVLVGDMSLVGPRPPIPAEVHKYEWWQRRRLSTRPGITCLWQVKGRNRLGFDEWMRLDLEYIDRWSLALDFALLVKTIPAVLRGSGQ